MSLWNPKRCFNVSNDVNQYDLWFEQLNISIEIKKYLKQFKNMECYQNYAKERNVNETNAYNILRIKKYMIDLIYFSVWNYTMQ